MEVAMSLNPLVRLPLSNSRTHEDFSLLKHSVVSTTRRRIQKRKLLVVEAKGRKGGMAARQYQRGTTAKIMVAAKDNFLGKYIYKDTLARNLAAVIYNDEKEIKKLAMKQHRVLKSATEFRYGYKLVENNNLRAALSTSDVIELPTPDKLKTVVDKVKDFFGDAKESFGKLTALPESSEEDSPKEGSKDNTTAKK